MYTPISSRLLVNLHIDPHGFRIEAMGDAVDIGLDQIVRIDGYERGDIGDDLANGSVCLDILVRDRGLERNHTIHDAMRGFDDAMRRLEELDGFDVRWRERLPGPTSARDRIAIYRRN